MHFRYLTTLTLCLVALGCTSLKSTPSDGGGEDDPDAGGMSGQGGQGGQGGQAGQAGEAGNNPSGGMGGSGGGMSGSGGSGGSGATGGSGGTMTTPDCTTTDCDQGESCIDGPTCVPTCSLDDSCDVGEACLEAENCPDACTEGHCRPSCAPDCEVTELCVEGDDCESNFCDRAGDELTGACRPDCAETDSCETGERCTRSEDCTEGTCSGMLCHPVCGAGGTCTAGSACATGADCAGDAICDAADHVCLVSCSGGTLASQADFEEVRYCWELTGDVVLNPVPALATIDATVLPYLTDVTGSFLIGAGATVSSLTMPALSIVKGSLATGNNYTGELHFPNLLEVGTFGSSTTSLEIALTTATIIDMPRLATIYGTLNLQSLSSLTSVDLHSLAAVHGGLSFGFLPALTSMALDSLDTRFDVNGSITLDSIPNIPWTSFDFILPLNGNETVFGVGCDTSSPCNCGNSSCVPEP